MTKAIRQIRVDGNIAYVPLTKGYEALIDAADVPLVEGFNWYVLKDGRSVYAMRTDRTGVRPRGVLMHRVIAGDPDGMEVDHHDTDGLNNRRLNLRVATKGQNQHNRRHNGNSASRLKGASFCKRERRWRAQIKADGKKLHLGYHPTEEAAHAAYVAASERLHGYFGRTS